MAKRPDGMESLLLAIELLQRIPRRGKVTAQTLHEQLHNCGIQRDVRTIQRILSSLCSHFDIERDDSSKPYGYRWKEHAKGLALATLTPHESLLLALAEQQMHNQLPARLLKSMQGFFHLAKMNLGLGSQSVKEKEWLSKVRLVSTTQPLLPPKIAAGVFEEVSDALYSNHWLDVAYKNAAGKQLEAEVMPLGLAQQGERLYLVCRFKNYDNERSLALHRILSATKKSFTFIRPNFDLRKYDNDGGFGFGNGKRVRVSFLIDKDAGLHLLESPLSEDQQVIELEDQYQITATLVETLQLHTWLNGFGEQICEVSIDESDPE